jgi:hypothetical protein
MYGHPEIPPELRATDRLIAALSAPTYTWRMWSNLAHKGRERALINSAAAIDIVVRRYLAAQPDTLCRCDVGCQECPVHPGRLKTKEECIAFRKAWDAKVEQG